MEIREVPGLEFRAAEIAAFTPLLPIIDSFAHKYELNLSRVRDGDPVNPHACYFLSWRGHAPRTGGRCWISLCARDPLNLDAEFQISAMGYDRSEWNYSVAEGAERLWEVLEQALSTAAHR